MVNKLIIYGVRYFDILKLIDAINEAEPTWEILGYIDDTPELQGTEVNGYPILGNHLVIPDYVQEGVYFANNLSRPDNRRVIAKRLADYNCKIASLIHPSVDLNYVQYGIGTIIHAGVILGGNVVLGDYNTIRYGVILSHDVKGGQYGLFAPGSIVSGYSSVGDEVFIGAGSTVTLGAKLGNNCIVGAGAVVISDVGDNEVVAGVPAKVIKMKEVL